MALADFGFDFQKVLTRLGRVYGSDDDGVNWNDLGRMRDVNIEMTKVVSEKDQNGREKQLCMDVVANMVLTQTSDTEFDNLTFLTNPSGDGLWVKFTDDVAIEGTTPTETVTAADGILFKGVLFTLDGTIDYSGNDSMFSLTFTGRISMTDLQGAGTVGEINFGA